jgi:hypothetical protein
MGAWSHDPFGNDDALDLLADIERDGLFAIGGAFQPALEEDWLDAPLASKVVAAAALLAAGHGAGIALPDGARGAVARLGSPPADLLPVARKALRKVVDSSELEALWAEGDGYDLWLTSLSQIQAGLA